MPPRNSRGAAPRGLGHGQRRRDHHHPGMNGGIAVPVIEFVHGGARSVVEGGQAQRRPLGAPTKLASRGPLEQRLDLPGQGAALRRGTRAGRAEPSPHATAAVWARTGAGTARVRSPAQKFASCPVIRVMRPASSVERRCSGWAPRRGSRKRHQRCTRAVPPTRRPAMAHLGINGHKKQRQIWANSNATRTERVPRSAPRHLCQRRFGSLGARRSSPWHGTDR